MLFETVGDRNHPVIVMINGSFTTGEGFAGFAAKYLKDDFYVIAPTYDGHYEGSAPFDSREGQAAKILAYLKDEAITEVAVLQGLSMGAEVALDLMHQICEDGSVRVHRCFFDGGPYFSFPGWFRRVMYFKFRSFLNVGQKKGVEAMMNNRMIRWMMGDMTEYRESMTDVFGHIPADVFTAETIRNETEACYTFDFPELSEEQQKRCVFSWSSDEPAAKSSKKIKVHYPHAGFCTPGALGHSGYMIKKPQAYADQLRKLAV